MYFLQWKPLNFIQNFTEICSWGPNCQYGSIGSDNGLVPMRQQAIIWTNDGFNLNHLKKIHCMAMVFDCILQNCKITLMIWPKKSSFCSYQWLNANLQYLHCEQTGDMPVPSQRYVHLGESSEIISWIMKRCVLQTYDQPIYSDQIGNSTMSHICWEK